MKGGLRGVGSMEAASAAASAQTNTRARLDIHGEGWGQTPPDFELYDRV